jgi:SulP family sulfate permease
MIMTFIATLIVPLQFAVLLGVALSIVLHVVRASNKVLVTEWALQPEGFPIEREPPKQAPSHQFTLLNIYGSLFFAAAGNIEDMLPKVDQSERAVVAIIVRGESEIGSTFLNVVQRYAQALNAHGGRLMLVGVDPALRDQLAKTGALKIIGEENIFLATPQVGGAVNAAAKTARAWLAETNVPA